MANKEIITGIIDGIKQNAGKIAGVAALGTGVAVDVIRARRHKATLGNDDGQVVEADIDTIDDSGTPVPEPEKDE